MKRFLCIILLVVMLFSFASFRVFSADVADEIIADENAESKINDVLYFSCSYNSESRSVTLNGSMNHDAFATYSNSTLVIYAIPPGMSELEAVSNEKQQPLAEVAVSIRFGFSFKVKTLIERYSRYAIFLRSEDGVLTLATDAQYPEIASTCDRENLKEYFKGISTSFISKSSDMGVGSAIIPVYLDELFIEATDGYIYQLEGSQFFFSKSYVDELDTMINSLSATGTKIYLQLLLRGGTSFGIESLSNAEYYLPDVYRESVVLLVHSVTEFLTSRYCSENFGHIFGIIVGKGLDNYSRYNFTSTDDFEEYVERCGLYTVIVANAARSVDSSLDIVLPFTAEGFHGENYFLGEENKTFSVKRLIEAMLAYFDDSFAFGLDCSFLMETTEVPFGITNENIDDGVDKDFVNYVSEIYAGGQKAFSEYCGSLISRYESAAQSYIFQWSVPENLSGNALAAAYAYSYYSLLGDEMISCFTVDIGDRYDALTDIFLIMKYIDTPNGITVTQNLLDYFGINSWSEILNMDTLMSGMIVRTHVYTSIPSLKLPENIKGSFDYFEFSSSIFTDGWYRGVGCKNVKTDYTDYGKKALRAELYENTKESSELIYVYDRYENMIYTSLLEFDIRLTDGNDSSLYDVTIILENEDGTERLESTCILKENDVSHVVLDISEYSSSNTVKKIKISVRSMYGDAQNVTLWLEGIRGHSAEYSSDELYQLIVDERDKINKVELEENTAKSVKEAAIAIGIAIVVSSLAIGLFLVFKKNRYE